MFKVEGLNKFNESKCGFSYKLREWAISKEPVCNSLGLINNDETQFNSDKKEEGIIENLNENVSQKSQKKIKKIIN